MEIIFLFYFLCFTKHFVTVKLRLRFNSSEKQTNLNLNEILLMFCENLYDILLFTQGNQVFFFFLVLILLFFLVLATFQSVKKKMISTMKNSCLPKLICELNASTNKDALTEGEKSLLKLIRWVGNKYNYLCISRATFRTECVVVQFSYRNFPRYLSIT